MCARVLDGAGFARAVFPKRVTEEMARSFVLLHMCPGSTMTDNAKFASPPIDHVYNNFG
jgi:hypothetical protein